MNDPWLDILVNPASGETELIEAACLGNKHAASLLQALFRVSQIFDDLYDQDQPISPDTIEEALWLVLAEIPGNPFYQQNFLMLYPLISAAIQDWMDANQLQAGNDEAMTAAWVLRDSASALAVHVARLCGGIEWSRRAGPILRQRIHDESVAKFKESISG